MAPKLPVHECKAFLVCGRVEAEPKTGDFVLVGLPTNFCRPRFPAMMSCGVFVRLTSARGQYQIEMRLQNDAGEVLWSDGPPEPWNMRDPLTTNNVGLDLHITFPAPGLYDLVLVANGDEISRQRFAAVLVTESMGGSGLLA